MPAAISSDTGTRRCELPHRHLVDESVFSSDAPKPVAGDVVSEWLRFAYPVIVVAHDVGDQRVDPLEDYAILPMSLQVVAPACTAPGQPLRRIGLRAGGAVKE